jgi:hypothetical protein
MEGFGGDTRTPKHVCLERVRSSDVYLGIFGMRYGSVDEETGQSITELEYREARRIGLPCMIYLIDENKPSIALRFVDRGTLAKKLEDLKSELRDLTKGHVVRYFSSPEDLRASIAVDVAMIPGMITRRDEMGPLNEKIEAAITALTTFVLDMEIRPFGGWAYHGTEVSPWDTASSLLALVSAGAIHNTAVMHRGQQALMRVRNRFGGWRSAWERDPDASSTVDTAIAIAALLETGYTEQPWELEKSLTYLRDARIPGSGWPDTMGTSYPSTAATAWATRAVVRSGLWNSSNSFDEIRSWLLSAQQADGGWSAGPHATHSTIGKTRDALMALSVIAVSPDQPLDNLSRAIAHAANWLRSTHSGDKSTEQFAAEVGIEPQGIQSSVETVSLFLEAAFYAGIPASDEMVKADLDWITRRPAWSHSPMALSCLSRYRTWIVERGTD